MPNIFIVCHGAPREFSNFSLANNNQEVKHHGNFGAPLPYGTALTFYQALRGNVTLTDAQLGVGIHNYHPTAPITGPGTFGPDIDLSGDNGLLLFIANLANGNYFRLQGNWTRRLSQVIADFGGGGAALSLHVACCTEINGAGVQPPAGHAVASYANII
jgi:hypothetical protein